jgi:hypothetical protein
LAFIESWVVGLTEAQWRDRFFITFPVMFGASKPTSVLGARAGHLLVLSASQFDPMLTSVDSQASRAWSSASKKGAQRFLVQALELPPLFSALS